MPMAAKCKATTYHAVLAETARSLLDRQRCCLRAHTSRVTRGTTRLSVGLPCSANSAEQIIDAHTLKPATTLAKHAKTPFPGASAEYRKAREAMLAEEIEFRRHMTRLTEQRRALPPGPV